jgi:hypothetical protein
VARKGFQAITDGTNGPAAVTAASTAAIATDPSLVVSLSPNNGLPAGANTIGIVNQGTAASIANSWRVQVTDLTNTMPTGDAAARGIFVKNTDGTSTAAVKAASTAAVAADPALVVSLSPNNPAKVWDGTNTATVKAASTAALATDTSLVVSLNPNTALPAGANAIGTVTCSQSTAANLNATVVQPTASLLNATVVGSGSAGTPAAGVVTVQGIASMTALITAEKRSASSAVTSVAASATSVNLLASNANRIAAIITNDGSQVCYVKLGTTASNVSYTYRLTANSAVVVDGQYTGAIDAIWSNASGNARITELT